MKSSEIKHTMFNVPRLKYILIFILFLACQTNKAQTIQIVDKAVIKTQVIGKKVQLIDVRTPEEYAAGNIDNAVNYNIANEDTFLIQIQKLNKNLPVYLYCKAGVRSNKAAKLLKEEGFTKIYDYAGGYNDWIKSQ